MNKQAIKSFINGQRVEAEVDVRVHLADFLRQALGLTGTHIGCEHGACGACTVIVDGRPVRSCLMLAVQVHGAVVETVESLGRPGDLSALQMAFSKDVGYSPRDYLMQCRLDLARARLQSAATGERISDIAFDCGFTDLGFFARRYRDAYGELPSATMKNR